MVKLERSPFGLGAKQRFLLISQIIFWSTQFIIMNSGKKLILLPWFVVAMLTWFLVKHPNFYHDEDTLYYGHTAHLPVVANTISFCLCSIGFSKQPSQQCSTSTPERPLHSQVELLFDEPVHRPKQNSGPYTEQLGRTVAVSKGQMGQYLALTHGRFHLSVSCSECSELQRKR